MKILAVSSRAFVLGNNKRLLVVVLEFEKIPVAIMGLMFCIFGAIFF